MTFVWIYLFCALGVVISVVLPILRYSLPVREVETGSAGVGAFFAHLWVVAKPFLQVGAFSLIVALLVVAAAGDSLTDWRAALLAGYAADSTLQELKG